MSSVNARNVFCGAGNRRAPVLHEDAGGGRLDKPGEDSWREHDSRAVGEAAAGQQEGVVCDVRLVAEVFQRLQPLARRGHQPLKQPPCHSNTDHMTEHLRQ